MHSCSCPHQQFVKELCESFSLSLFSSRHPGPGMRNEEFRNQLLQVNRNTTFTTVLMQLISSVTLDSPEEEAKLAQRAIVIYAITL